MKIKNLTTSESTNTCIYKNQVQTLKSDLKFYKRLAFLLATFLIFYAYVKQ